MANQIFRELSSPLYVQWEVTPNCNYNCIHCYNYWRDKTHRTVLSNKINTKFLLKCSRELIANKIFNVVITGGEPLLVIDQFLRYANELADSGIRLHLNTNLSLATPAIIKDLLSAGIGSILTSLHSCHPSTNDEITQSKLSLERTTNGIRVAIENGITPSVNMVISKKNLHHIFDTAKYVKKLGVTHFCASKAAQPLNCPNFSVYALDSDEIKYMINELSRIKNELKMEVNSLLVLPNCFFESKEIKTSINTSRYCLGGKTTGIIGYDGNIRACLHMSKSYGSITNGLRKAWKAMNEDWRTDKWLPKKCGKCKIKIICAGGCKVEALTHNGTLSSPDPLADFSHLFKKLPKNTILKLDLKKYNNVVVPSVIRFRKEKFGGVIVNNHETIAINNNLYEFLLSKKEKKQKISIDELSSILKSSRGEAKDTLRYLLTKSMVINYNEHI